MADSDGWATRHVVAQMKRTDRDKDWPIVKGLGQQLKEQGRPEALLHLMDWASLATQWKLASPAIREAMALRRPLLRLIDRESSIRSSERWFLLERLIWEKVNQARHACYTRAWRNFYRQWRQEPDWEWLTSEAFAQQHRRLLEAARRLALPSDPLGDRSPEMIVAAAIGEVRQIAAATAEEIAQVLPPVYELLP